MPRPSESSVARDATGSEAAKPAESTLTAGRNLASLATVATALPKTGLRISPVEDLPAALLSLNDEATMGELYGLTRKEAELAAVMLKGKSLKQAAAELAISPQLARNHLRRILMKTDMARIDMRPQARIPK